MGGATVALSGRGDGDLRPRALGWPERTDAALRSIADHEWRFVGQVHGDRVIEAVAGEVQFERADALVSAEAALVLAVLGADCALIGLSSKEGVIGAVHAGWRGVCAGVIGAAAEAMRARGATRIEAALSPCVHPECYPFSPADLDSAAARLGDHVRAEAADGSPAFDLPKAVRQALEQADAPLVFDADACTACGSEWFSARGSGDSGRHLLAIWREP